MSDSAPAVDAATATDNTLAPVEVLPPADTLEAFSDPSAAARYLASLRGKKANPEQPAESAEPPATAETEPAEEAASDQPEEVDPAEVPEAPDPAEKPSVEPPRSWTKEAKERWATLPRDTQEYLAQREQERDREVRRSQNDAAEQRKSWETRMREVDQLKQQYEAKLPSLVKTLEDALQNDFADIRSFADARKMQTEDPFRFQAWQLRQMEIAQAQKEQNDIEASRSAEIQSKWNEHTQTEAKKFEESLSEGDKKNLGELMKAAPGYLEDRGFTREELSDLWTGKDKLSLHDHRLQSLILDGMKYRDLQKAPAKAVAKPVPPVQRPGAAPVRGAAASNNFQALNQRLGQSGRLEDAVAAFQARRSTTR